MDLADLVPSLKRAIAPPGEYADLFPESDDETLAALLADAVAECMLDGFLSTTTMDLDSATVDPDLTSAQQALVILYGMARVLTARMSNLKNHTRYKAGNVEAEVEQSASIIVELLRQTKDRKAKLIEDVRAGDLAHAFAMVDMYIAKSIDRSDPDLNYYAPSGY